MAFTPYPRAVRVLFVVTLICFITALSTSVFVAARNGSSTAEDRSATPAVSTPIDASVKTKIAGNYGKLPLSFEVNEGQVDRSVKFVSRGPGYDLFLTSTEAVLSLLKARPVETDPRKWTTRPNAELREGSVLRLKMLGANAESRVEGHDELPGKVNYFIGNDPEKWRRNVRTYRKVYYKDVYPGIDIVYYGNPRELEYDLIVAPGADPRVIKFRVDGADRIRLDETGSLVLAVKDGEVRLNKPFIYQLSEKGDRTEVKGAYAIKGNEISFKVRRFDSGKPLVIDPVLSYGTFLGSSSNDHAFGIAVDSQGSAYVTGVTSSSQFPTTAGSFTPTSTTGGAFVTKLDPSGSTIVYSTYLNGRNGSTGNSIAVDSAGNAYVTGQTFSMDFPIVNALKTASNFFKTTDSAVNWNNINSGLLPEPVRAIAIAPSSPNTIYAGLSGGPYRSNDGGSTWTKTPTTGLTGSFITTMAVDPANASIVYAAPGTSGSLFRSTNGGDTWTQVNGPIFFAGVNAIVWDPVTPSTMYLGTGAGVFKSTNSGNTWTALNNFGVANPPSVRALAIDPTTPGTIYAGAAGSPGLFKTTNGGTSWTPMNNGMVNAFTVNTIVIDPFDSQTVYAGSGFIGGSLGGINKTTNGGTSWTPLTNGVPADVPINAMVADRTNAATVYAATASGGVIKTTNGGTSWTKVNSGVWKREIHTLVAHPSNSSILFAGGGGDFQSDAFVTKLNSSGSALLFSTFLGGSEVDIGNGIAVDGSGNIYVAGGTNSPNFPAANAFQPGQVPVPSGSNCNSAFVSKINPAVPSFVFSTYLDGSNCEQALAIALDTGANVFVTGNTNSSDFPVANAFQSTKTGFFDTEAYVTKFSTTGSLVYSTYLGGTAGDDTGFGIAIDAAGNAHVTGTTTAGNFPTLNPIQANHGGGAGDVFVTKLNGQGSGLIYSTFLGGSETDVGRGIALDSAGNAYLAGFTSSVGFPLLAGSLGTKSGLYKSLDGAATWSNDNYGLKSSVIDLAIHPTQPATIYAATDFGVFKSTNGGKNWTAVNNGLNSLFVRAIVIDPVNPSTLYAAVNGFGGSPNDGVYKSTDGGNSWNLRKIGLTGAPVSLAINPAAPTTLYAASSIGPVFKTTDGADNWARSGTGGSSNASSVAVDPQTPTTVFANELFSNGGIWRSSDSGETWQKVNADPLGPNEGIVVSPLTAGLVFATGNGGVFKSVDNGSKWTQVRTGVGFARVTFDPVSSSTVYVASGNEGILKSTDSGQTWTSMNKGLRIVSASRIAIDPLRPSTLYVASSPQGNQSDAFVTKINPTGSALIYSTLIGGEPQPGDPTLTDSAFAIAVDSAGNAYVTGLGRTQLPLSQNSYQPFNRGADDAFIAKLVMSHIISGRVKDAGDAPISGADVVLNDGTSIRSLMTESDGSYEFSHLIQGGNFTVSASKPHFSLTPVSQTFNNLTSDQTLDFTAAATNAAFHTITGQITNNGVGLANVTVTLSGSQPGLRTTDSNGNYSFELAAGGNYTVMPSIIGFAFAPLNLTFNNLSAPQTANFAGTRQNFVVTNANNHGTGSLREAITNANATVGLDTIVFNIPGTGVKVINLLNALPEIIDPVVIDGTTQPGYAGMPLVELDGSLVGTFGTALVIKTGGSTVRGLALGRSGVGILLINCDNNVIQANHIGVDATGTASRPNGTGIRLTNSSNNVIGGTTAGARNVISGNGSDAIEINGNGNIVQGNYIGTNAAGTAAIPNGSHGVSIPSTLFTNNVIGGATAGAGNLISGNNVGIKADGTGTTIQGNLIGTDVTGTQTVGNGGGITATGPNTQIGGLTAAARNIISGNGTGLSASGAGSKIQGNFIGTDITGTLALGNTQLGIGAANVLIGGTTPEARNIISANGFAQGGFGNIALGFNAFGPGATVQGNYIGTDVTGAKTFASSDPFIRFGITVFSNNHVIGGTQAGARNVISGHDIGIQVGGFSSPPTGVVIQGNFIGLNAQGTAPLPNLRQGIRVASGDNNIIGGIQSGAANKIAFNGLAGIAVESGTGNSIRGNSIFSNGELGIDLGFTSGVTLNDDGDLDPGANNLQNFPVLTSVSSSGGNTTIQGSLSSTPNTTFQIDFYSNAAVDGSGHGEGALFFATTQVTTSAGGNGTINATFPMALPAGRVITATATSPAGNTSEFSAADTAGAAGTLQFAVPSFVVLEDIGQLTVTVQRVGGSSGSLSVQYATANGTAIAGQDYTAASGTLNFANGETSKTFQVPITNDVPTEPDETFTILLTNASNLEALGVPLNMAITIQDKSTVPTVFMLVNPAVLEGDTGTTTDARFEVRLSAATGRTISVNYATANVDAHGGAACGVQGVDYESRSGTTTFQPGTNLITIPVRVCGDSSAERNEQFGFQITNPVNATIPVQLKDALGTIINDDVIQLLLEESGPGVNQVAALDALTMLRDPFGIVTVPEAFANGTDRNTRVALFVRNLQLNPGETSAAVVARLVGSNNQFFDVPAEDFRAVPGTDFMQATFRLPNNIAPGTAVVTIRSHTRVSNMGTLRIAP